MKYYHIAIVSLLMLTTACADNKGEKKEDIANDLEKIDSQKGEFNPAYINDPVNSHLGVSVLYANNQFTLVPAAAELRPGRPPYSLGDTSKPFVVRFKDAANKLVGSYSFLNPGLTRACEGKNPGFSIKDSVRFDILIPNNRAITNIEISSNGKPLTNFQLPPVRTNSDTTAIRPQ